MKAKLTLHPAFQIGEINPRIYCLFIEHMGRVVYNGIYEPTHPTADENGFRQDVKQIVKEMNVPILRYPGGNFLSGYDWKDGVGPRKKRPRRLDAAWQQLEPNEVGTDEFHDWAKEVGSEVMMAVNLGTKGPEEAAQLLEYCNMPAGSLYEDIRVQNGHAEPYRDEVWCLGNEMDGIWQIGCRTAEDYGDIARKTACLMKKIDPKVMLIACGSANLDMPTFGSWEDTVLSKCYDHIDMISLHQYFTNDYKDRPAYLANAVSMDEFINSVIAICDSVAARQHKRRKINLSFDEWNIWPLRYKSNNELNPWEIGPAREEFIFSLEDALLFGSMMLSLIRNCDRVEMACMAQLVNVCAPIMTVVGGPVWKQTTYYPFQYTSQYGRGVALTTNVECEGYRTNLHSFVPYIDAMAVWNTEKKEAVLFAVNRSEGEKATLDINLESFGEAKIIEHVVLVHEDCDAINTAENPDNVVPHADGKTPVDADGVHVQLAPYSWNMIRLSVEK